MTTDAESIKFLAGQPKCRRRQDSNFFEKFTYSYISPLISNGYKNQLQLEDYPPVETADEAQSTAMRLQNAWIDERIRNPKDPKLWKAVARVFAPIYALGGFLFFLESVARLGQAIILAGLLNYFADDSASLTQGMLYALGLSLLVLFSGMSHHINFFYCMRAGLQVKVSLIALVYKKILNLSVSHTCSSGFIVNMVSNDVQRFEDVAPFANFIWLGPLEVVMSTYFMFLQISWAAFAAVGALLLLIPIQSFFAHRFGMLRKETVVHRDDRIRSISDLLTGIMVVKLYAWENPFSDKINKSREEELFYIRKASLLRAFNEAFWFASSVFISAFPFITYYLMGGILTPAKVFSTITVLMNVRLSMTNFFPKALQFGSEAIVSIKRIQKFLELPEIQSIKKNDMDQSILSEDYSDHVELNSKNRVNDVETNKNHVNATPTNKNDTQRIVKMSQVTFSWDSSSKQVDFNASSKKSPPSLPTSIQPLKPILIDINFQLKRKELLFLVGQVGAGKSSFLNAILGEMNKLKGKYAVRNGLKIAYASQNPWILSGSVKDNILFGSQFDTDLFDIVLEACDLKHDLTSFEDGANTLIGERGVNLSGGQRARLSLARAAYSRADLYLLDDPLSAVDAKVGRHLFEKCIKGLMKESARLLVTHQLQYIHPENRVVLLEGGRISQDSTYKDLINQIGSWFHDPSKEDAQDHQPEVPSNERVVIEDASDDDSTVEEDDHKVPEERQRPNPAENEEKSAVGSVTMRTYIDFFTAGASVFVVLFMIVLLVLGQVSLVVSDYWLARWSTQSPETQDQLGAQNAYIYGILVISTFGISILRATMFFMVCVSSTRQIFTRMLQATVYSPMQFFNNNPVGRVMNRFSKDMNIADETLPWTFFDFLQCAFMIIGTIVTAVVIIPYVLVAIPFIAIIFYFLRKYFVQTSRQIKRLESTTRSPVYSQFSATLDGLPVIRAYQAEGRFWSDFTSKQNDNTRVYFAFMSSSRWLGFRLDMLAASFLILIAFLSAGFRDTLASNAGLIGLVLAYCIQLLGLLQWAIRQSAEVENLMTSAERCLEYTHLPPEAPPITSKRPPTNWPDKGCIQINSLSMTYPGKDIPTLKNLTLTIDGGSKVGVVGRTGAGKSSFLQVLFRLVEPSHSGAIVIDNINISELGLFDLRSRISIIPQEPFCFKGTLRFNIDPFNLYDDDTIWKALDAVELKPTIEKNPDKLEAFVSENGSNWSFGERQLICLARAILRNTNLIVMDEATSAVDLKTDALVQKAIRSTTEGGLFKNATVITIAHRLNTVIDFDYILVLDQGSLVEFGNPFEMLSKDSQDPTAWFKRMVDELGVEQGESLTKIAKLKYTSKQP